VGTPQLARMKPLAAINMGHLVWMKVRIS
jgi:hypothetical protein